MVQVQWQQHVVQHGIYVDAGVPIKKMVGGIAMGLLQSK